MARPVTQPVAEVEEELHKEEGMVANWRQARSHAVIGLIFLTILFWGCGGMQPLQDQVTTEYLLNQAGFTQYKPNMETPKTQALLDALPEGQVTTFRANGVAYHAYPDKRSNVLYVGDQAAYEKYASMAQDKKVCQRVDAPDSSGFWGCFQEMQQKATK
ncbi:MAG: hypothetical protein KKD99_05900 [Proteobacteria bacterium]|nr:hypothetical protein [Pseudomonadota bacterium]MBU4448099.1 hypothetical protein [Pseudomonadota bacterium]